MDYYLSFPNESDANEVLYVYKCVGWNNSDPENPVEDVFELFPAYSNIDTIGLIYKPTGEMLLGEDGEYPEMAPIEGWHVNVRLVDGEDAEALEPFEVSPETPVRVWG
jgi:hypothetical protein